MIIIYLAKNLVNGKRYIGQTGRSLSKRVVEHSRDRRSDTLLSRAIRRYGIEKFEWVTLAYCKTGLAADEVEQRMISCLQTHCKTGYGYNRAIGGRVRRGWSHTDETKEKFVGRRAWNKGLVGVCKSWNKGLSGWTVKDKKRQEELKASVSRQMTGNRYAAGNKNNRKAVRCIDNGMVFESLYHASDWVRGKFERSQISAVCNGRRKTAYGHRWEFVCQQ